jgi:hypothetical protein
MILRARWSRTGQSYATNHRTRTEWLGVEPADVEHGDINALMTAYPDFREEIRVFAG